MRKYYFTFGCGIDNPNRNKFVCIESCDYETARETMYKHFGNNWAIQYTEDQWIKNKDNCPYWDKLVARYGLDYNDSISQQDLYNLSEIFIDE